MPHFCIHVLFKSFTNDIFFSSILLKLLVFEQNYKMEMENLIKLEYENCLNKNWIIKLKIKLNEC